MNFLIPVVIVLCLLVVWRVIWRSQPVLALGLTVGIMVTAILASLGGLPHFDTVPLWLPPLPFAIVALTLFAFGILAWIWGDQDAAEEKNQHGAGRSDQDH